MLTQGQRVKRNLEREVGGANDFPNHGRGAARQGVGVRQPGTERRALGGGGG